MLNVQMILPLLPVEVANYVGRALAIARLGQVVSIVVLNLVRSNENATTLLLVFAVLSYEGSALRIRRKANGARVGTYEPIVV